MIFAEIKYPERYEDFHDGLLAFVGAHFSTIRSGLQGDSWIWIFEDEDKVAIDTFTSMKHQIKSSRPGPHVRKVLQTLALKYELTIYGEPELEGHEDG